MSKNPDPIDLHVGARIRYRRMSLSVSQEALASKLGVTFQQIQKYEKGQNRVGASRLWQIARELGCQIGFFFEDLGGLETRGDAPNPIEFVSSPEGLQLNLAFQRIRDAATRRKIAELVSTLADGQEVDASR